MKNPENSGSMSQEFANKSDDDISLLELWSLLWAARRRIIEITSGFAIASIIFALLQTNIYRAEAVLVSAETRQSTSPLAGQLGAAASLVGISVGGGSTQIDNAISILKSREFLRTFVITHELAPLIMASEWDGDEERNVIDPDIYNEESASWVDEPPSDWDIYERLSSILFVEEERTTGLIRVAIEWSDPAQAAEWANLLVADINKHVKDRDLEEAQNAIQYLREQLQSTQLVEMQRVFYQLIESQTRVTMLADVRDEYVFRVIDLAVVPEDRVRPSRALICILGTILGGIFAVLYVLVRNFVLSSKVKD